MRKDYSTNIRMLMRELPTLAENSRYVFDEDDYFQAAMIIQQAIEHEPDRNRREEMRRCLLAVVSVADGLRGRDAEIVTNIDVEWR